jgi:RimJ/RimL family protein N-acetyltransferase
VLRPATVADLAPLQGLARSDAVRPYVSSVAADEFAAALEDPAQHPLVVEASGGFAGGARLVIVNARSRIWSINSVMLDPVFRGRGLGAATIRALALRAFDSGAHRVQAEVLATNAAGLAAFDAAGFTREGVRRQAWDRDGWQDGVLVGMLDHEVG